MSGFSRITTKNSIRSKRGTAQIAELPPALLLLLVIIFFPLMDFLYIGLAFGAGWYLNQMEMRDVQRQAPQSLNQNNATSNGTTTTTYSATTVDGTTLNLPSSLQWNGFMGVIEGGSSTDSPQVTYYPSTSAAGQVGYTQVVTYVSIAPLITTRFKWLPSVPGLNETLYFTYTNTIFQEESAPMTYNITNTNS